MVAHFVPPPKSAKNTGSEKQYQGMAYAVGITLHTSAAYKEISRKRNDQIHVQIAQYFFLPGIFSTFEQQDPGGTYLLETKSCIWKPGAKQFRRFMLRSRFPSMPGGMVKPI